MRRRGFVAGLLSLPVVAGLIGRRSVDDASARTIVVEQDAGLEMELWERLDHASSWRETVEMVREYIAEGGADGEVLSAVADTIERHIGPDEPGGVLGLYPATVLMLASLEHVRRYGSAEQHAAQDALIRRFMRDGR